MNKIKEVLFFFIFQFLFSKETDSTLKNISENMYQIGVITISIKQIIVWFPREVNKKDCAKFV
jgi:hypothetical protein